MFDNDNSLFPILQIHNNAQVSDPSNDLLPDAVVPETCQTVCLFTPSCNGYQLSDDGKCDLIKTANAALTTKSGWKVYLVKEDEEMMRR